MLKIYFNEKSDAENKIKITVKELCVIAEVTGINPAAYGKDVIETLRPYSSYILVDSPGKVKNYRKMNRSDFKFLDMNRLGVAVKMDFARLLQLYASKDILQLDTGIIGGEERDIIIRVFEGRPVDTEIEADEKYEVLSFNSDDLVVGGSSPSASLGQLCCRSKRKASYGQQERHTGFRRFYAACYCSGG